jgi:hypothetical protein
MARLLMFLMILTVVTTQGLSAAAAVCRHDTAREHVQARQSKDAEIASVSLREDAAASASTKATGSGEPLSVWPAKLLPAESPAPPLRSAERLPVRPARQAALPSLSVPPLLKPPSA